MRPPLTGRRITSDMENSEAARKKNQQMKDAGELGMHIQWLLQAKPVLDEIAVICGRNKEGEAQKLARRIRDSMHLLRIQLRITKERIDPLT